jgi:hypothetical protein
VTHVGFIGSQRRHYLSSLSYALPRKKKVINRTTLELINLFMRARTTSSHIKGVENAELLLLSLRREKSRERRVR